jgi:hypothetical protein
MPRLDAHTERGNRIMERNEEAFRDLREYLAAQTVALGRLGQEFTLEMRAQRTALYPMLDRLGGNGGPVGGGAP